MHPSAPRQSTAALALAAIGVVYGDIGTSPLYTLREVFGASGGVPLTPANLVGACSVIVWALTLVVTLKYVILILRADNAGEGGIMALVALAARAGGTTPGRRAALLLVGVAGASLFYGDGIITPAISVLSAVEGLEVATPALKPYVLPLSVAILVALFMFQRHGTERIGRFFGPVVSLWFLVLAVTGLLAIARAPEILAALSPLEGWHFLRERGPGVLAALGAIVLAVTGAEALYADLGHFGRSPIRLAWLGFVFPALGLNYLGQGALLLADPAALDHPFYRLFPDSLLLPAVALATGATIIASQAVISGAYSLTRQAIQLGFLPRMHISHTSAAAAGQIYMPAVNGFLLAGVVLAVLGFGSSSALASAYGIAVTLTMLITTFLTYFVVRHRWRFSLAVALGATGFFLAIDLLLVASCSIKFADGGWFPIALGAGIFVLMATWKRGRELLMEHIRTDQLRIVPFIETLLAEPPRRCEGNAVFMVADPDAVPQALLHNLKHNKVLHRRNLICTVLFSELPWVAEDDRVRVEALGGDFWRVLIHYGFKDEPDIPAALGAARTRGLELDLFETSFFLSRETVVPGGEGGMARWRDQLFTALSRNAGSPVDYFHIPPNSVIELGTRIQI